MKIRTGFVSNSSSSSFIIDKYCLTGRQIKQIKNHSKYGKIFGIKYYDDNWRITETPNTIGGFTLMDNFDMNEFLEKIGVDKSKILWEC